MDNNNSAAETAIEKRPPAILTVVLGVVFVVFCAILVFVFVATKHANPVMLDQQGKPLEQQSQPAGSAR
jgi:flagellar basal body-associated protein FliL